MHIIGSTPNLGHIPYGQRLGSRSQSNPAPRFWDRLRRGANQLKTLVLAIPGEVQKPFLAHPQNEVV